MDFYDYIIVGAGAAGCVLAARLSEDPRQRVLLIEAGPDDKSFFTPIPMGMSRGLSRPRHMWHYGTEPEEGTAGRPLIWPRGKTLGGSSAVNAMIYSRAQARDFEQWAENSCDGWGWAEMRGAFEEIESHQPGGQGLGSGGPVHISPGSYRSPLSEGLLVAAKDMGTPVRPGFVDANKDGIGYVHSTIRKGRRQSAAECFLKPARKRSNLRVVTDTRAERLILEGRRVVGVECVGPSGPISYRGGEIIVSGGTIESPKLLQLSGIGPGDLLSSHNIPVVEDNPHVGAHMQDHKQVDIEFRLTKPYSHNVGLSGARLVLNALRYQLFRTGPLARGVDMIGFIRSDPALTRPDIEFYIWFLSIQRGVDRMLLQREPGAWVTAFLLRPHSEGSVRIRSSLASDPPIIRTNLLENEQDCRALVNSVKYIRTLFRHPAVTPFIASETRPGHAIENDAQILEAIRQDDTQAHAAGTCRMGAAGSSVLDSHLRVRNIDGLRVVDLSITPSQISASPYGSVMAMAWRAADIIIADREKPRMAAGSGRLANRADFPIKDMIE